ncbi:MAG: hypothetical protein U0599_16345 [Vicinamibacteria bacterium]
MTAATAAPNDGAKPPDVTTNRPWPAALLVLFVVLLGLLPHLRFSLLVGEPTYFFSAFDEEQYSFWALGGGGPNFPHRWLSSAGLWLLSKLAGGSWNLTLILADAVFPAGCAVLAWIVVGHLTRRPLLRLVVTLGLLFAQEFFSLGCWTIWQSGDVLGVTSAESRAYDLRHLRELAPGWLTPLWPDYGSPFLTQYRTPEPQISRAALFAILAALLAACRTTPGRPSSRAVLVLGLLLNAGLLGTYLSQAAAIIVLEGLLALALLACRRSDLARIVGGFAAVGTASLLAGTLVYVSDRNALGLSFASRLPVVTPSVVVALAGLAFLGVSWRHSRERALYPVAAACFGTVLALTNQQVITGRMILASTWERYVDYPLVFLGIAIVAGWRLRGRASLPSAYAVAGAAVVLAGSALVTAQDRVFQQEYLVVNLESVAMRRAVQAVEARGLRDVTWLLTEPSRSLMLEARLERRIDHLLDVSALFRRPVDPLARPEGEWGARSPHARQVFEYLARRPRTPAAVARQLNQESEGGTGDILRFLFDYRDFWAPMTDGRQLRSADVRARIPEVRDGFARYLEAGDPCWSRPVVVLTRQAAGERVSERWNETFLLEATVGRDHPLMNMNAFLQTPSSRLASGAAQGTAGTCASVSARVP